MNDKTSSKSGRRARGTTVGSPETPVDRIANAVAEMTARLARIDDDGEADRLKKQIQELRRQKTYLILSSRGSGGSGHADSIEPRHGDAETARFTGLPNNAAPVDKQRPLKICIAAMELDGPDSRGDIGTAYAHLAELLAATGHHVTILYGPGERCENGTTVEWIDRYEQRGIELVPLPKPEISMFRGLLRATGRVSRCVYEWLKDKDFDLVHVADWQGVGYFSLLAKHQGLAFRDTLFCVKSARPTMWDKIGRAEFPREKRELIFSFMERRSVELADIVVSGNHHMLRWMLAGGYNLDRDRCHVQPDIVLPADKGRDREIDERGRRRAVDDIVFLGSLEQRSGIHIFCEALTRLARTGTVPKKVTFLGRSVKAFDAIAFIDARKRHWPFDVEIRTGWDTSKTLDYLRHEGRLAVVPSMSENTSFAISNCLGHRICFLASDRGGNPELIDPNDHDDILFDAHPVSLFRRLEKVLKDGAPVARPAFDNSDNLAIWGTWHASLSVPGTIRKHGRTAGFSVPADRPLVSVCLAHYERPELVVQAIQSIEAQSYDNYEVVLVDDGSTSEEAVGFLKELTERFAERGWKVVLQENRYLGASRNTAVRHASGDYLLFMDDDNVAKPNEIETFLRIAQTTGADILTCFADVFEGDEPPSKTNVVSRITPIGASLALGMFANGFGDSNCFVKRTAFENIGGFTEDYRIGRDDQEFFARAVLSGLTLDVVPEALYWYRQPISGKGMKAMNTSQMAGELRVLRPYISSLPLIYRDVLLYTLGLENKVQDLSSKLKHIAEKKKAREQHQRTPKKAFFKRLLNTLSGRK